MVESLGNSSKSKTALDYGACSHVGQRPRNEDSLRVPSKAEPLNARGCLFAVADGMGGHSGGGLASRMACQELESYYQRLPADPRLLVAPLLSRLLMETVIRIDRSIRRQGTGVLGMTEMGTTLSCLMLTETHSIICHVGDSRIYRLRHHHLTRLTTDHTFVQDMIFEGEVDPTEAGRHPLRHLLTRVVGTSEPLPLVDTRIDHLHPGDRYLLCTDGLSNTVADNDIADLISRGRAAAGIAEQLVVQALQDNARDNITAVVVIL